MEGYLGETPVNITKSKFKDWTPQDWAMLYIEEYGGFDGDHHKTWVLDQVSRILKGTGVIVKTAKWEGGHEEYRYSTNEPSQEYLAWVIEMCDGEDGPNTYSYDEGRAP